VRCLRGVGLEVADNVVDGDLDGRAGGVGNGRGEEQALADLQPRRGYLRPCDREAALAAGEAD
jgi:hypothetical protein